MRYAIARYQSQQRDLAYRIFVTDCLRMELECTAHLSGVEVRVERFADLLFQSRPTDNRTADEIINGIRKKL